LTLDLGCVSPISPFLTFNVLIERSNLPILSLWFLFRESFVDSKCLNFLSGGIPEEALFCVPSELPSASLCHFQFARLMGTIRLKGHSPRVRFQGSASFPPPCCVESRPSKSKTALFELPVLCSSKIHSPSRILLSDGFYSCSPHEDGNLPFHQRFKVNLSAIHTNVGVSSDPGRLGLPSLNVFSPRVLPFVKFLNAPPP